eukprot:Gb_18041 [translate_table: standard]
MMGFSIDWADDGVVRIQMSPIPGQLSLSQKNKYWQWDDLIPLKERVHDMMYGAVGGAVLSYDNQYMASVGHDGSFFVYKLDIGAPIRKHEAHPIEGAACIVGTISNPDRSLCKAHTCTIS